MAVKQQMLIKKRAALQKRLAAARARKKKLRADEAALQQQVDELEEITPELEQQVDELTEQQTQTEDEITDILDELDTINQALEELGAEEPPPEDPAEEPKEDPAPEAAAGRARRSAGLNESVGFRCRSRCFRSRSQRDSFYARPDVKGFLGRVRSDLGARSNRAVKGADLTIPQVVMELLRDNMEQYSKLINKVRYMPIKGRARQPVLGEIPEGIWTEMAGVLNELTFTISEVEMDGYKVGGYIAIDNYLLADSDLALGEEILYMLGQAIGLALDKAILFGTGSKMPVGIVTRLKEEAKPGYWTDNRAEWTDLHTTNLLQLDIDAKQGPDFFVPLLDALRVAKVNYTDGTRTWIMNRSTRDKLLIKSLGIDSAAAIVAGMQDTMPILGGEIITLEFMTDNQIVGGALGDYLLVEREGASFGYSDIPFFIQDKTVYKGTARYDGQPVHGEDFIAVSFDNTEIDTTGGGFAADSANAG